MKTLHNTYCKPNIEEWEKITALLKSIEKYYWRKYDNDGNCFLHDDTVYLSNGTIGDWNTRTEIPVQHFIDLIEDTIVAWRLEDDFFIQQNGDELTRDFQKSAKDCEVEVMFEDGWFQDVRIISKSFDYIDTNCKTYSDLLTLIRLLK
jgi:hypothetical protein